MTENAITSLSGHQVLHLNSWHFVLIAVLFVLALRCARSPAARKASLLVLSAYFLFFFLPNWYSAVTLAGVWAATYLLGEIRAATGARFPSWVMLALWILMWTFLFMARDGGFLADVNLFHYYPVYLIGISYIVFRCMHYIVDAEFIERRNPITLLNYLFFFPTYLSGPIERYERFEAFQSSPSSSRVDVLSACHRIADGAIKKYILADYLITFSLLAKRPESQWPVPLLWVGFLLVWWVVYLDFSGYCDIVIGICKLAGFDLTENFDRPFLARNVGEFWKRWNITMTDFVRTYIFSPIAHLIIRRTAKNTQFLCITALWFGTMLLIGVWHETSWGLAMFGVIHGSALALRQFFRQYAFPRFSDGLRTWLDCSPYAINGCRVAMYLLNCTACLFFAVPSVAGATSILKAMFGLGY
jgi:alginate O-acetyltransferase complex protein AlgI